MQRHDAASILIPRCLNVACPLGIDLYVFICIYDGSVLKYQITKPQDQRRVAHLRLFVLSKFMVTFLKNETYGNGSRYSLKNLCLCTLQFEKSLSLYPTETWYEF